MTLTKLISKVLSGIALFFILAPATLALDLKCEDLNVYEVTLDGGPVVSADLAEANAKKLKNYITTVLEEEIGSGSTGQVTPDDKSAESLTCFRVTGCKTANEKVSCSSAYGTECTPGENIFCQRVQVLVSQSGIDLLMSYLGIVYRWAASVIGVVSVAYLIYGGFLIGTAQDDAGKIDKAKEKIFQSIAGLVLLFLSAIILYTINPNFFTLG